MQAETDGRRREHYSSFDLEAYQARSAQATAWLEDKLDGSGGPDDVYTLTPRLHSNSGKGEMRMPVGMAIILLLERYVQIYVLKRLLICTVYQEHRTRTRE